MSAQFFALIEHFKQADPVGLPGAPVPDPFTVPDVSKSIGMGTLKMKNTLAYGLSRFRVKSFLLDVKELMVFEFIFFPAFQYNSFHFVFGIGNR